MANWSNLRLLAIGRLEDLRPFRRAAGALTGRIDTRRSTVFRPEMEEGEGGDLYAERLQPYSKQFRVAKYYFQGRNTDHAEHFQGVSRAFPALAFVLVYSDPNADSHGSYLLLVGSRKHHEMSSRDTEAIVNGHKTAAGVTDDDDDETLFWVENEAYSKCMDIEEQRWESAVIAWLRSSKAQSALRARRTPPCQDS